MFDLLLALPQQGTAQSTSSGKPLSLGASDVPAQVPFSQVLKQRYVGGPIDANQPVSAALLPTPVAEEIAAVLSQTQSTAAPSPTFFDLDAQQSAAEVSADLPEDLRFVGLDDASTAPLQPAAQSAMVHAEHGNPQISQLTVENTQPHVADDLRKQVLTASPQPIRANADAPQPIEQDLRKRAETAQPQPIRAGVEATQPSRLTVETTQPLPQELLKQAQPAQPPRAGAETTQPSRLTVEATQPLPQELLKQTQPAQPQPIRAGVEATQRSRLTVETTQPLPQALLKQAHQPADMLARIESSLAQSARLREAPAASAAIATMTQEIQTGDTTWVRPLANTLSATAEPLISATVAQQAPQTSFVAANGVAAEANIIPATTGASEPNIAPMQTVSAAPTPTTTLSAPLATPAWQAQLSQQVSEQAQQIVNMRVQNDQTVRLRLHPAELGPLMISMKIEDQSAQLQFVSGHNQVRQAVEQALPQLREILAEQGIELSQSSVRDHGANDQHQEQSQSNPQAHRLESEALADNNSKSESVLAADLAVGPGRVNVFA
ncbi:MAG: flagellar hook-length control protein FliK [Aliidiomarina sp.]|uniref:flagellar hook-length control protein FliK n=1 Tax=Aliidiomarina sp. TaxID=1872439 RepID=UPI0025C33192|nr:flagellar hook-length control protein FliK [Aliidiomarina sp.]MCH8501047.1 flagellar hook-length control protein FliK [Aliidiomarina sp.]